MTSRFTTTLLTFSCFTKEGFLRTEQRTSLFFGNSSVNELFELELLTDSWNMAHTTIVKIKNTTDSLILQSCAANVCTVNTRVVVAAFIMCR